MIKWLLRRYYKQELNAMWEIVRNKDEHIKNLQNQIITMQGNKIHEPKERIYLR